MRQKDFVHQQDAMQCGVACLAMVGNIFGMRYSLPFLTSFCSPTAEGVSLKGISDGASSIGLSTKSYKLSTEQLTQLNMPAILHWNQNHFVVIHKVSAKGQRFHIADPAKGMISYSRVEFEEHWCSIHNDEGIPVAGIAMSISKGDNFGSVKEENNPHRRSLRFMLRYLRQYKSFFIQIILGLIFACVLQLIFPFLTQAIVDKGIHESDIHLIWLILIGELLIVAGRTSTDFIRRWLMLHVSMRINISLLSDFFIKLMGLPMSYFDTKLTGDIMQRMGDHGRIQTFLTSQVLDVVFTVISFLVFSSVLLVYNKVVFAVFIGGSLIYTIWTLIFLHRRKVIDYELFEQQARNQNLTYQLINNMQEIKLQDCERRRRWEWEDCQASLFEVQMKSLRLSQTQEAGSIFISEIRNIVVTVLTATAVIHGDLTLGGMLAIQYIIGQVSAPIAQLMGFIYSLQDVRISLERINQVHTVPSENNNNQLESYASSELDITLTDVRFKYDRHAPSDIINGISMHIPAGKTTAIVGASGSGKTTLIKLILGYYPVVGGNIDIAGANLEKYNLKWWRDHCGVVMQDGVIFSESIERNIATPDAEVDHERLEYAARMANIHDHIMTLPLKYSTQIGRDGIGLSKGQIQRILIARAIYKNPDFILMDEATNSLDASNEKEITERLEDFFKQRTVIIVAHRLSTVRNADNIIVLDKGQVAESGTHEQLTTRKGIYYKLVKNQLELGN